MTVQFDPKAHEKEPSPSSLLLAPAEQVGRRRKHKYHRAPIQAREGPQALGFGWSWLVLVGFGWFWLVLVGFGWCWGGCWAACPFSHTHTQSALNILVRRFHKPSNRLSSASCAANQRFGRAEQRSWGLEPKCPERHG